MDGGEPRVAFFKDSTVILDWFHRHVVGVGLIFVLAWVSVVTYSWAENPQASTELAKPTKQDDQAMTSDRSELTLKDILEREPNPDDYSTMKNCIILRSIDNHEALNERLIIFEMKRGEKYLVQLRRNCHGMKADKPLRTDSRGNLKLCRGDYVRARVEEIGNHVWGPPCYIPGFEPVTDHQIALLKEGIQSGRVN